MLSKLPKICLKSLKKTNFLQGTAASCYYFANYLWDFSLRRVRCLPSIHCTFVRRMLPLNILVEYMYFSQNQYHKSYIFGTKLNSAVSAFLMPLVITSSQQDIRRGLANLSACLGQFSATPGSTNRQRRCSRTASEQIHPTAPHPGQKGPHCPPIGCFQRTQRHGSAAHRSGR